MDDIFCCLQEYYYLIILVAIYEVIAIPYVLGVFEVDGFIGKFFRKGGVKPQKEHNLHEEEKHEDDAELDKKRVKIDDDRSWKVKTSDLQLGEVLKAGTSGFVYKATWQKMEVAAKIPHDKFVEDQSYLNTLNNEISLLAVLQHPNIVLFLGASITAPNIFIILEYMLHGSLKDYLSTKESPIESDLVFKFCRAISRGMNYLHHHGIVHEFLSTSHILLDKSLTCKICDFSSSKDIGANNNGRRSILSSLAFDPVKTPYTTAPEVLLGQMYNESADVYSFGVILWEILAQDVAFKNEARRASTRVSELSHKPTIPPGYPELFTWIINTCWELKAEKRPTFTDILEKIATEGETK